MKPTKTQRAAVRRVIRKVARTVAPPATVAAREANAMVFQTFVAGPDDPNAVETRDPADRAHSVRDDRGYLVPAAIGKRPTKCKANVVVEHARPRIYPACHVNAAGLAIDSQFDALYEAQQRLEGVPGLGFEFVGNAASEFARAAMRMDGKDLAKLIAIDY